MWEDVLFSDQKNKMTMKLTTYFDNSIYSSSQAQLKFTIWQLYTKTEIININYLVYKTATNNLIFEYYYAEGNPTCMHNNQYVREYEKLTEKKIKPHLWQNEFNEDNQDNMASNFYKGFDLWRKVHLSHVTYFASHTPGTLARFPEH